jgi:hypothetical protein
MTRQILTTLAVTLAFAAGAAVTAVVLGMPTAVTPLYLKVAILAGLLVDGLRFIAARFWHRNRQLEHDLEDIFRSSLA